MSVRTGLRLYEEVLLLSVHDERGSFHGSFHSHALAGAMVTELVVLERFRAVEESRNRTFLEMGTGKPTGDPLLDEVLERVAGARRRAQVSTWVGRIAGIRRLRHRAAERLVERGLLRAEAGRILGVFPTVRYPTLDPGPEARLRQVMERTLLDDGPPDPHGAILLSLARASGILRHHFDRKLLRQRRDRLKTLQELDGVSAHTRAAVQATRAAVTAAVAAAAAAS